MAITIIKQCRGTLSRIRRDFDAIGCRAPSLLTRKYIHLEYLYCDYVGASNDLILVDLVFKTNKREVLSQIKQRNNSNNSNRRWNVIAKNTIMALLMSITPSKYSFDFVIAKIDTNVFLDQTHRLPSYWHVDETSQSLERKYSFAGNTTVGAASQDIDNAKSLQQTQKKMPLVIVVTQQVLKMIGCNTNVRLNLRLLVCSHWYSY